MGWFHKDKKIEGRPILPKLPELPNFPSVGSENQPIHQLPSFPTSSLGEKFSQDTIKEAVSGKKEEGEMEDEEFHKEIPMTQPISPQELPDLKTFKMPSLTQPLSQAPPITKSMVKENEPIFIRIDKFEESLKIFQNAKKEVTEIESMLTGIKELKQKEEEELSSWEKEIQLLKHQIEKTDKNLFSKIE